MLITIVTDSSMIFETQGVAKVNANFRGEIRSRFKLSQQKE